MSFFSFLREEQADGLHYWHWDGRGLSWEQEKLVPTRSV
jgi:hypothetical protein